MPAASPVRRRSGACSDDAWELHLVNTERLSDGVALRDLLSHFFLTSSWRESSFWQKSWVYSLLTLYQQKSLSPRLEKCRRASWIEQESIVAIYQWHHSRSSAFF